MRVTELKGSSASLASSMISHTGTYRNDLGVLSGSLAEHSNDSGVDAVDVTSMDGAAAIHGMHEPRSQSQQRLQSLISLEVSVLLKIAYVNLELKNWSVVIDSSESALDKAAAGTTMIIPSDANGSL
jgi:hypothetical protein